jgi:hypothetical protein
MPNHQLRIPTSQLGTIANCCFRACFSSTSGPDAKSTWSYGGSTPAYSSGGYTYNSSGYLANPSRSAQIEARNAGALTNYEASRMGLQNRR